MYTIVKKIIDGIEIIGYVIVDESGVEKPIEESSLIPICKKGLIENASVVKLCGEEKVVFEGDLNEIPSLMRAKTDMNLKIIGRIISRENGKACCTGYVIQDRAGKKLRVDNVKAWKLARYGNIIDIKADIIGGVKVLRGEKEGLLENLPVIDS